MGTDIHFYVERRTATGWASCDTWEPDEYDDDEPKRLTVPYRKHFYDGRNYDLFAMLADVRNGAGFAGVKTGDGFVPICEPRGLPDDMSPELAAEAADGCDHTPSWLTVKELMDYDWTQTTKKTGIVSALEYEQWSRWDKGQGLGPRAYSGGIWGGDIEHISEEEMARRIKAIHERYKQYDERERAIKNELIRAYCQVEWETPYYRAAGSFLSETLPRLWRLGKPEDVRVVFWFDS
jgi:hypothetical protein